MLSGFRDFVTKGNLIATAVALVMALATVDLVNSLIENLITPLIGAVVGEPDFGGLTFTIRDSEFAYGEFVNALITFVSIAAAVYFFIVRPYQRFEELRGVTAKTRACDRCKSEVAVDATRCAFCTSDLTPAQT